MIALAAEILADLIVQSSILAYVGNTDVHWSDAPEGSGANRIVFKRISDVPLYDSDDRYQRWRFYIQHTDKYNCERLAEALYNHLHRKDDDFDGTAIDYCACVQNNDPEWLDTLNVYEVIQDYMINYH